MAGGPPSFPPSLVVQVKALACELRHRLGLPLSRLSIADIQQEVVAQGLVAEISGTTLWRWLNADALRPWQHRSWIFPATQMSQPRRAASWISISVCGRESLSAPPILSFPPTKRPAFKLAVASNPLYRWLPAARCAQSMSTSEKVPGPIVAAWDVHRAKLFGRRENQSGIAPTARLTAEIMTQEPYQSAHRAMAGGNCFPGAEALLVFGVHHGPHQSLSGLQRRVGPGPVEKGAVTTNVLRASCR